MRKANAPLAAAVACLLLAPSAGSSPSARIDPRAPAPPPLQDRSRQGERKTPPQELQPGQRCVECHEDLVAPAKVHAPVSDEKCELCHPLAAPDRHLFLELPDPAAPCIDCHQLPERPVVHKPVAERKCLHCHVPHHSPRRYLLRKETEKELCGECHEPQVGRNMKFIHGPVALGACTLCHSPHATRAPKLLKTVGAMECMDCHTEVRDELGTAKTVHAPVAEDCTRCHDPHATNHRFQLKSEPEDLCVNCHEPMMEDVLNRPFPHEALTTKKKCENCHEVHSSALPSLLTRPVMPTCMSCHDDPIPRKDGTQFPGMGNLLRNSKYLHGPIREGNCAACHDPHGAQTFSILRDPYPMRFYSPFAPELYTLCFRCHDATVFTTAETRRLTRFRDGTKNLHYLHVNQEKGRTCRTCHETHGSNLPNHISTSVPFGSWDVPINFQKTETGGSCAPGCHEKRTYDNQTIQDGPQ